MSKERNTQNALINNAAELFKACTLSEILNTQNELSQMFLEHCQEEGYTEKYIQEH